jgi:hypothetical protein
MASFKSEKIDALNRPQAVIELNLDGMIVTARMETSRPMFVEPSFRDSADIGEICSATKSIDAATRKVKEASRALCNLTPKQSPRDAPASVLRPATASTQRSREGAPAQAGWQGLTGIFRLRSQQIYEVVHVDEQTDRLWIRLPASGADATHAGHFGSKWAPQHNFSTSCPFMDRRLPTKCIVALRREASNRRMCRC